FLYSYTQTAPTDISTLSLHDALPIWWLFFEATPLAPTIQSGAAAPHSIMEIESGSHADSFLDVEGMVARNRAATVSERTSRTSTDRKSTRLNSSHDQISYAVFCLKKK